MSLTLNLHYLTRQLKFVFLFVIWSYCLLRISHNTISTAWVSLSEGFFHPDGLTKWWFYITMMPGWWFIHLMIIIYIPLILNKILEDMKIDDDLGNNLPKKPFLKSFANLMNIEKSFVLPLLSVK